MKKVVGVFVLTLAIRIYLNVVQLRIAKVNTKTPTTFFSTFHFHLSYNIENIQSISLSKINKLLILFLDIILVIKIRLTTKGNLYNHLAN